MFYDLSVSKITENNRKISLSGLAVPKFFELIFVLLIGTVNTVMLSGYSADAVTATSVAGQIFNLINLLPAMVITGARVLLSIALGQKDDHRVGKITGTTFVVAEAFSLILGIICAVFASRFVRFMNLEGQIADAATGFLRIKLIFVFITTLMSCFNQILLCHGYARYTLLVGITSNVLNALFGYIVLYSGVTLPFSGVNGVAYGSVTAQLIAAFTGLLFCLKKGCFAKINFDKSIIFKLFKIGMPGSMNGFSYTLAQLVTTGFVVTLGAEVVNTKVYIANIVGYTSQLSLAVAQGSGILVGRYRGSGDFGKVNILHWQNIRLTVLCNVFLSVAVYILRRPLLSMFTDDSGVIAAAGAIMLVDIVVEGARAVNQISEASLIANGDVKTTFFASVVSCWGFSVLFAYLIGVKMGYGLLGCWIAFAMDELFKNVIYFVRWKSGKWKYVNI